MVVKNNNNNTRFIQLHKVRRCLMIRRHWIVKVTKVVWQRKKMMQSH